MSKRFIAATVVAASTIAGAVVSSPAPSSAETVSRLEVSGNFAGDAREEVFVYTAGTAPDYMVSFANQGIPCGQLTWARYPHAVNGSYYPVAVDFDGDAYDEIVWHAPGAGQDYLMDFPSFTTSTVVPLTVNGDYIPLAGDFSGDGAEDLIWYAGGTAQDYWLERNPDGSVDTVPLMIDGAGYVPLAGSFGMDDTDDVHWYAPGPSTDYFWDFVQGTHDVVVDDDHIVNGSYDPPFVLDIFADGWRGEDAFWYAPGPTTDYVWDYLDGEYFSFEDAVQGTYRPTSGDYFNDGHDDALWMVPDGSRFFLWDHFLDDEGLVSRCVYSGVFTAAAASQTGVAGTVTGSVERAGG